MIMQRALMNRWSRLYNQNKSEDLLDLTDEVAQFLHRRLGVARRILGEIGMTKQEIHCVLGTALEFQAEDFELGEEPNNGGGDK